MGAMSSVEARQCIRDVGLRATAPRIAVLQLLTKSSKPLSHTEVVDTIGTQDWDQATVYRNLLKLVEVGLARVANRVDGIVRYDAQDNAEHQHPHFTCRICGAVECLPQAKLTGTVDRRLSRSVADSELQLIGECPECRAAAKKTGRSA